MTLRLTAWQRYNPVQGRAKVRCLSASPQAPSAAQTAVLLPALWEQNLEQTLAKYSRLDERLDFIERQMLELTRELKTGGTVSVTGGTSISSVQDGTASTRDAAAGGSTSDPVMQAGLDAAAAAQLASQQLEQQDLAQGPVESSPGSSPAPVEAKPEISKGSSPAPTPSKGVLTEISTGSAQESVRSDQSSPGPVGADAVYASASPLQQLAAAASQEAVAGNVAESVAILYTHRSQELIDAADIPSSQPPAPPPAQPPAQPPASHPSTPEIVSLDESPVTAAQDEARDQIAAWNTEVAAVQVRLEERAAAATSTDTSSSDGEESTDQGSAQQGQGQEDQKKSLLGQHSLYNFSRLQSLVSELSSSGVLESIKQLRETLLIQEWDMTAKHEAKRRGVAAFEKYVAERDLVHEIGGYDVITALYMNPDGLVELLPNQRMRMLLRSTIEEHTSDRRSQIYSQCTETAKEMSRISSGGGMAMSLLGPIQQYLGGVGGLLAGRVLVMAKGGWMAGWLGMVALGVWLIKRVLGMFKSGGGPGLPLSI